MKQTGDQNKRQISFLILKISCDEINSSIVTQAELNRGRYHHILVYYARYLTPYDLAPTNLNSLQLQTARTAVWVCKLAQAGPDSVLSVRGSAEKCMLRAGRLLKRREPMPSLSLQPTNQISHFTLKGRVK